MPELRILLADDHAVVREGLRALIQAEPGLELIADVADGESACREAARLKPDVVVMDVSMPGRNGAEATEQIKRDSPDVRVVALTAHEGSGYVRRLLDAGASGYVLKRAAGQTLIEAIRTVAAGGVYLDPSVAGAVVRGYVGREAGPEQAELSDREEAVLRLLAEGYSNKEIAARLELSIKTVETYKARGMEKLGFDSRVDLVRHALRQGWLIQD